MIVARGMGVRRGGRWLLRPVTFGVPEGVVGLAGPPGAGKSTLLATFATLRKPNTGVLHILGHDIANATGLRAARAGIGYLPARFSRAESMTAGEFVAYAAYYKRTSASAARSMLRRLDLTEAAGTELALLPPDVRLRAGLAAACVHEPEVVLLDDPFGELCAAAEPWPTGAEGPGRRSLTAAMAELIPVLRSLAPAVVVTADVTETLTGWCDRLFTLTRGRAGRAAHALRHRPPGPLRRRPPHRPRTAAVPGPAARPRPAPRSEPAARPESGERPRGPGRRGRAPARRPAGAAAPHAAADRPAPAGSAPAGPAPAGRAAAGAGEAAPAGSAGGV
ncbi:ATP-binding cassette domain-containing protein [Actinomadura madurae]|uniref:ATP-binding cassette domain-containing protein n=1 Tax=Actinomadura madurae TaxID=1993 RepID=UPI0020D2030A|nr:ATP-binding cassette domain-containing protein [Actinomadura madurae]MCQ0005560.1 ATP-binding cassette domain-containing protein [Actinomadura madurae]